MMRGAFVDSDVILDVLAARAPFYEASSKLLSMAELGHFHAFSSPIVFANLNYILRKIRSKTFALESLRKLRSFIRILPVAESHIDKALSSNFTDFEDALQYFSACDGNLDFIVTRNKQHFKPSKIAVCTPTEFLKIFHSSNS